MKLQIITIMIVLSQFSSMEWRFLDAGGVKGLSELLLYAENVT